MANVDVSRGLTPDEMAVVIEVVQAADTASADNFFEVEDRTGINLFRAHLMYDAKPYKMVSPDGYALIHKTVFSSPTITDYILTAYAKFSAFWIADADAFDRLTTQFARSASVGIRQAGQLVHKDYEGMPSSVRERLITQEEAKLLLQNNGWLLMCVMISTLLRFPEKELKQAQAALAKLSQQSPKN